VTRCLILVIALAIYPGVCSWAQDETWTTKTIPSTVSEEAQEFLRTPRPPMPIPTTDQQWQDLQKLIEEMGLQQSKEVAKSLGTKVEVTKRSGVPVHIITPKNLAPEHKGKALIHVHGGGYCIGTAASMQFACATVADLTKLKVYCIDYRLAPQHPFPAGLDDCVNAYEAILENVPAEKLGLFGVSAGGSMVVAMTLKAMSRGLPAPAAVASITPWADLTLSGDTYSTNDEFDPVLDSKSLFAFALAYSGHANRDDPLVSPLFAKYSKDFPATLIQTGSRDVLLSDCVRLHQQMKKGGVDVELSVYEGMWHGFHLIPNTKFPEAKAGFREVAEFFNRKLKVGK
jgi:monoterpene epsilon-lactone hydrolase